ncbi:MAG: hypothetical protein ACI31M_04290 [Bacilli bacterium]
MNNNKKNIKKEEHNLFCSNENSFNKIEAQIDEYSTSLSGTLDSNDSYDKDLQEQAEAANEESYYNIDINKNN